MTTPRARIDALRRLAADQGATEAERENARRRIAEHEKKYGAAPRPSSTRSSSGHTYRSTGCSTGFGGWSVHFSSVMDDFADAFWRAAQAGRDFNRGTREAASGFDPIDPGTKFRGRKLSEFAAYVAGRWAAHSAPPGPFGRVPHVIPKGPFDDVATFTWPCPHCGTRVQYTISWKEAGYAAQEPAAMETLLDRLFAMWDGRSDNRCESCRARARGGPEYDRTRMPNQRDVDWFIEDAELRRARRRPGSYGHVRLRSATRDVIAGGTLFNWECPICGRPVAFRISDDLMYKAGDNKRFRNRLSTVLADHMDGYMDNRCTQCKRTGRRRKPTEEG